MNITRMMPSWGSAKSKRGRPSSNTAPSSQSSPSTIKGSQEKPGARPVLAGKGVIGGGKVGTGGKGLGQGGFRRHRYVGKECENEARSQNRLLKRWDTEDEA